MGPRMGRPRDRTAANVPNPNGTCGFWETRMPTFSNPDSLRRRRVVLSLAILPLRRFTRVTTSRLDQEQKFGFLSRLHFYYLIP